MARRALLDDRSDLDSLALVCRPLRRPRLPTVWALDRKTVRGDARSVSVIIGGPPGLPWSACTPGKSLQDLASDDITPASTPSLRLPR